MSTADDRPATGPRQTLAMRLAERNRQRALRAERLARLRPGAPADGFGAEPASRRRPARAPAPGADAIDSAEALEEFLRALSGAPGEAPRAAQRRRRRRRSCASSAPSRPRRDPEPGDLDRLTGAGPGLIWALSAPASAASPTSRRSGPRSSPPASARSAGWCRPRPGSPPPARRPGAEALRPGLPAGGLGKPPAAG